MNQVMKEAMQPKAVNDDHYHKHQEQGRAAQFQRLLALQSKINRQYGHPCLQGGKK